MIKAISFLFIFYVANSIFFEQQLSYDLVHLSFYIVIIQPLVFLFFAGKNGLTLLRIFYFFQFIFMGIAPYMQFIGDFVMWGGEPFYEKDYLLFNVLITLVNFLFFVVYYMFNKLTFEKKEEASCMIPEAIKRLPFITKIVLSGLCFICFFLALYINNFSIVSLFLRGGILKETAEVVSSQTLIFSYTSKFIPFFITAFILVFYKQNKLMLAFSFITLLLCAFPFGIARFLTASIYIPLLLIAFPSLLKGIKGILFFILSILLIFPFLEQFRVFKDDLELQFIPDISFFVKGHFDSYQNFLRVFSENITTGGNQLIGVLFFFVPRSIWEDKPVGSGYYVAEELGYTFNNISMNFFGEGFINFGILGVVIFCVLLSLLCAFFDRSFWSEQGVINKPSAIFYLFLIGYLIFVLRGDLLSSFAFFMSALFSFFIVNFLFNTKGRSL
ncbi:O-antigen polymerase [Pseudoalteromonas sp. 20-MNA-CIBAN-0454]|uniref:O-antigen polymerase n=1 Tax=Pseudoalteromonas sp. 20-MNA-CIBAN-0454 TaxID=3140424 RepID=UPI00331D53B6